MIEGKVSGYSLEGNVAGEQNIDITVIPRGNDGVSPTVEITEVEGGYKLTITDRDGTKEAVILDGADGRGIMMFYQSKVTTLPGDTNEWTVLYTDGTQSVISVKNGEDGEDGRSVNIESITESDEDGGENIVQFSSFRPNDPNTRLIIKNGKTGSPGHTPQKGVDYFDGKDGESISVSSVSESTDDNGENVVTFSDGKKLTVKNGSKGNPGYTPQKNVDYFDGKSGVHIGSDMPADDINVWIDPEGEPTSVEEWRFNLYNGTTDTKTVVVMNSDSSANGDKAAILRVRQADGTFIEIPALIGRKGEGVSVISVSESPDDSGSNIITFSDGSKMAVKNGGKGEPGYTPVKGKDYFDGEPGYTPQKGVDYVDGYTPIKGVDYFDGNDGYTPQKNIDYFDGKDGYTPVKGKDYFDGKDGTSVTITNVSESSSDGGSNVVTFSDGKTVTIKNGNKGATGEVDYSRLNDYAKKTDIPNIPVTSVNGKTGAVQLGAGDVDGMDASIYDPNGKAQDVFAYVDNNTITTHHLAKQLSVQGWYRVAVASLSADSGRSRSDVLRLIFGGAWESNYPRGFVVEAYVGCFQNGVFRQYPAQDVPQQITKVRMTTMDVNPSVFYLDVYYASTHTNTVYLTIQTPFGTCEPVNFEPVDEPSEGGYIELTLTKDGFLGALKPTDLGLNTEPWTFTVKNDDGTESTVTKEVYVG